MAFDYRCLNPESLVEAFVSVSLRVVKEHTVSIIRRCNINTTERNSTYMIFHINKFFFLSQSIKYHNKERKNGSEKNIKQKNNGSEENNNKGNKTLR